MDLWAAFVMTWTGPQRKSFYYISIHVSMKNFIIRFNAFVLGMGPNSRIFEKWPNI